MLLEYSVERPLNREPPPGQLIQTFITKSSVSYDRNHGPIPHINEETHYVRIDGAVANVVELSIKHLREGFEQHEVISSLQCAGNRRHTMRTELKEVNGIDWFSGAVMNGVWRGPLLRDVLLKAGVVIEGEAHVAFSCHQAQVQDDWYYGGSIDLARAMDPEKFIILALEFNGKTLSINHGYPVRAVLPGVAGARWVKWLDRITIQRHESNNYYQQQDYKILPPHVETKEQAMENWHLVPAMQLMPINSVICTPETGNEIQPDAEGKVVVAGYAVPAGDDGPVTKVEISLDRGETWEETNIVQETPTKWSWALWRTTVDVRRLLPAEGEDESSKRIWCRAQDKGGNVQDGRCQWNYRGVGYNGYGEVKNLVVKGVEDQPVERDLVNGVASLAIGAAA